MKIYWNPSKAPGVMRFIGCTAVEKMQLKLKKMAALGTDYFQKHSAVYAADPAPTNATQTAQATAQAYMKLFASGLKTHLSKEVAASRLSSGPSALIKQRAMPSRPAQRP
jgi:hypothetical protein